VRFHSAADGSGPALWEAACGRLRQLSRVRFHKCGRWERASGKGFSRADRG
jgi:hypothetical protein